MGVKSRSERKKLKIGGVFMYIRDTYKFLDEMPITMDVNDLKKAMNIGKESAYKLLRSKNFPSFKFANKYMVNKDSFFNWLKSQEGSK